MFALVDLFLRPSNVECGLRDALSIHLSCNYGLFGTLDPKDQISKNTCSIGPYGPMWYLFFGPRFRFWKFDYNGLDDGNHVCLFLRVAEYYFKIESRGLSWFYVNGVPDRYHRIIIITYSILY